MEVSLNLRHTREWFYEKLYSFFTTRYSISSVSEAEFYKAPQKNQFVFDFPDSRKRIFLTCDDDGNIEEMQVQYSATELARTSERIERASNTDNYETFFKSKNGMGNPLYKETYLHKAAEEV